jgi:hypothetical protein
LFGRNDAAPMTTLAHRQIEPVALEDSQIQVTRASKKTPKAIARAANDQNQILA